MVSVFLYVNHMTIPVSAPAGEEPWQGPDPVVKMFSVCLWRRTKEDKNDHRLGAFKDKEQVLKQQTKTNQSPAD